jgi:hypothetical protein
MENKELSPKRGNLEAKLQIAVVNYIRMAFPDVLCFAVPNGGKRSLIDAAMMKKMGVLAGVSDLLLFWNGGMGAIELKRPDKTAYMSPTQIEFAEQWQKLGGRFALCNSLDGVEAALKKWGLTSRYKVPTMEASGRNMLQQIVHHEMMRRD